MNPLDMQNAIRSSNYIYWRDISHYFPCKLHYGIFHYGDMP